MELRIDPAKTVRVLMGCIAAFLLLHIAAHLPVVFLDRAHPIRFFNLNEEHNIPTLFSTFLLGLNAVLLWYIGWVSRRTEQKKDTVYWWLLAACFLLVSIDESAGIHERLGALVQRHLDTSGLLYFAWVIPYSMLLLLLGLIFVSFFFRLPMQTRKQLLAAGAVYVFGGLGLELPESWWYQRYGEDMVFAAFVTVEEILEMTGCVLFVRTFLLYIDRHLTDTVIRIGSD